MGSNTKRSLEPHSRLTRIANRALQVIEQDQEYAADTDKVIMFLNDGTSGGAAISGYGPDSDIDAMVDVFLHLKAVFEANGKTLMLVPMDGPIGEG